MADFVKVTIHDNEVMAYLKTKQKGLHSALERKMQEVVADATETFFREAPGKYIDPTTIQFGVDRLTPTSIVGYVESTDKGGGYPILPSKARALRFIAKSGDLVFTGFVYRPYLKGSKFLEQHMIALKPWIEEQLTSVFDKEL